MFTNQNKSSGKFWLITFVVGLLIFFGQFANSQHRSQKSNCQKYDAGGWCTVDERGRTTSLGNCLNTKGSKPGCADTSTGQCLFGYQYCTSPSSCSGYGKGKWDEGSKTCGDPNGSTLPKRLNCKDPLIEQETSAPGEPIETSCVCKYTKKELVDNEECKKPDEPQDETAEYQLKCVDAKGKFVGVENTCYCENNDVLLFSDLKAGKKCNVAVQAEGPNEDASIEARLKGVLDSCGHTRLQEGLAKCEEDAKRAVENCDAEAIKSDKNAKDLGAVMKLLGTVQQNKAVQHADPDACGKAAYMGSMATMAIDAMKKTCEGEVEKCKNSCNPLNKDESITQIKQACEQKFNQAFASELRLNPNGMAASGAAGLMQASRQIKADRMLKAGKLPDNITTIDDLRTAMRNDLATLEKSTKDNIVKCEADAVKGETDIAKYLAEILGASVAAAQCKNLATTDGARCAAMAAQITPQFCIANPSEKCCCPMNGTCVGGGLDCAGKDYATKQCVCARTPDATTCKTTTTSTVPTLTNPGGVANLAAPGGIKSGSQYKPSGAVGGGFEVGTDMDPSKATNNGSNGGSANPFGVASGGGGGGGGGIPNSPGEGAAGAAPPASEGNGSLVGGAFNQLKTFADRMFGGGSSSNGSKNFGNGTGKDGKKNGANDPNGRQPGLRGVAGGASIFGPRNKDIWKIMNAQYGIQNHTFISNEK